MHETLAAAMERTNNRSRGFDYLRLILSASVLVWHSYRVSYAHTTMDGWWRPFVALILPMFFALSGFLVSGSLVRVRSIHEFVLLRAIRIVPALSVETVLSMVLLGSIFTTLPLREYLTSAETRHYVKNIYGDIHFYLPGVFKSNPVSGVNMSLWTIPYELECYLLIVVLWLSRVIKLRWALLACAVALQAWLPLNAALTHVQPAIDQPVPGRVLVLAFLFGVVLYFFRERVRLDRWLFAGSLAASLVLLSSSWGSYFAALPAAYATVYLGLLNPPKIPVLLDGDYSYGVYLYSYPIQQAITAAFPNFRHMWFNAPVALVLAGLCAAFSWHVVEKPVLGHRKRIVGVADAVVDRLKAAALGLMTGRRPKLVVEIPTPPSAMDEKAS